MKSLHLHIIILIALVFGACQKEQKVVYDKNSVETAEYLSLVECEDYVLATVSDPWKEGKILAQYALVEDEGADVPEGCVKIKVPLQHSVVYSSVHTAAIDELCASEGVVGVADASYFTDDDPFAEKINSGKVKDIGSSMSPSIEKIIDLEPDALLLSPWEDGNLGGVERSGVPLIFMADYLETTALGRAEWIKFIGLLYGEGEKADSIYNNVSVEYNRLKDIAAMQAERPRVITEKPYMGVWYVPGGGSYMAGMLADAGADYPWKDDETTGSLSLDQASVLDHGGDAQFWLIKDAFSHSEASFLAAMPHAEAFSAFPQGVYICNTEATTIFRDIAFHPERVLSDFIKILHPEVLPDYELRYYKPLTK